MKLIRLKNNYGNKGLYKGSIIPNSRWRFNCKRSTTGKRSILYDDVLNQWCHHISMNGFL